MSILLKQKVCRDVETFEKTYFWQNGQARLLKLVDDLEDTNYLYEMVMIAMFEVYNGQNIEKNISKFPKLEKWFEMVESYM